MALGFEMKKTPVTVKTNAKTCIIENFSFRKMRAIMATITTLE
jgi:hypothetical protein